ncbi:MAG TPA: ABC transporter ATP-binding protein [Candidatus Bathyarchaeia archaeon]|nr:ABC transporter ATP-binding protein [Candidatus Bathyarchaeia archaeon]
MNNSGAPLIKIQKLNIVFNEGKPNETRVLDNLDLDIYPHEYLILFGPSGCGKSTLLNVISGLLKPTSGAVEIEGKDIIAFSEKEKLEFHRRRIGMIFQSFFLVPTLSILDNVCLPRSFTGDDSPTRQQDALNLLTRFGIEAQAEKFPNDLSGGQRQRVAIARALINSPSIIVADEPVGNLDSKATFNVLSILKELNEVDKKLVVLVTHDPAHLAYGDRVIHMQDGKITKIVEVLDKKSPTEKTEQEFLEESEKLGKEWESFKEGTLGKAWELHKKGQLDKDWELVKKEELGKAFQAFKEGKGGEEWEMGKEFELVRKDELAERRKEHISPELLSLMRSFRDFSPDQVGTLLIPFKAQQIFSHIFFHIPDNQIDLAKKIFQDFIAGGITLEDFEKRLVESEDKGGAGWDHAKAKSLTKGIQRIFEQVKKIDFGNIEKSSEELGEYLMDTFKLKLGEMEKIKFMEYIKMRLGNELTMDELLDLADRPVVKGGVGLDRRMAIKIAREMEIIMLARYSM